MPTASAAGFQAAGLVVEGDIRLSSDLQGFFVHDPEGRFSWDLVAEHVTIERRWRDAPVVVTHPLDPQKIAWEHKGDASQEVLDHSAVTLASTATAPGAAILAIAGVGARTLGDAAGLLEIRSVTDPRFDQGDAPDAAAGERVVEPIHESLTGDFLAATMENGAFVLTGDFDLQLYGNSYHVDSAEGAADHQTGRYVVTDAGLVSSERDERHTLHLTGATLRVYAPGPAILVSNFPTLTVSGTLRAPELGAEPVRVDRSVPYDLASVDGLVVASAPDARIETAGAIVAQGPPVAVLVASLFVVVAAALAALVAWRRRERPNDLEIALVAMEERRWGDALPHLTRLARVRPADAGVQIDRALCLEQVGRFEEAAKAFEAALRAAPRHAEAHFYYARTLAKMRQPEAARVHLETALERDPRLVEMARTEKVLHGL